MFLHVPNLCESKFFEDHFYFETNSWNAKESCFENVMSYDLSKVFMNLQQKKLQSNLCWETVLFKVLVFLFKYLKVEVHEKKVLQEPSFVF